MEISANSINLGNILEYKNRLWLVTKPPEHTKPGKGGAYIQVELKDIKEGTKLNERFRSEEKIKKARLDEVDYKYLFREREDYVFMHTQTFEQLSVSQKFLAGKEVFLQESMIVTVSFYEDEVIFINLPDMVVFEIEEAEPVIKGQTATSSYKPAVLTNGLRVMVPPFVEVGDKIKVKTSDATYVERIK